MQVLPLLDCRHLSPIIRIAQVEGQQSVVYQNRPSVQSSRVMLQLYATEMEIAYATKVNVTSKTENSLPLILLFLIFASLLTPTPAAAGAAQAAFIRTDT